MKKQKPSIAVSDERGYRTLHVGDEAIQSTMRLSDPWVLALDYTRCMMAFLLFHAEPREALMIGLGGGSLAKFFHRNFKRTNVRVVELDERVVVAARTHFALPPDGDYAAQVEGRPRQLRIVRGNAYLLGEISNGRVTVVLETP